MSRWKRLLVIGFSVGAGITVAAAIAITAVVWYRNRPTPPKIWPPYNVSAEGIKAELKTKWSDGSGEYIFQVEPLDQTSAGRFDKAVRELRETELSTPANKLQLRDSAGFELCAITPVALSRVSKDGSDGTRIVAAVRSEGNFACSRSSYLAATNWGMNIRLPSISPAAIEAKEKSQPNSLSKGATRATAAIGPFEAEDLLTGFDFLNTYRLETRAGHTFVIDRDGERDTVWSWAEDDKLHGTSAKLKLSCRSGAECLIENETNGQAVHGRMIR